jgi:hypothetical protein
MPDRLQPHLHHLAWPGPAGEVTLTITHTKTFFGRAHVVAVAAPEGVRLPLDTLSYVVTANELERAGGAKAFVAQLLAKARTNATPPSVQGDLFGPPDPPPAPRRRGRRRSPSPSTPRR